MTPNNSFKSQMSPIQNFKDVPQIMVQLQLFGESK